MRQLTKELQDWIRADLRQTPDATVAEIMRLWSTLAATLVPVIGEEGFCSLFARSLHIASANFAWLMPNTAVRDYRQQFSALRAKLEDRPLTEAAEVGIATLTVFVETLVQLIDLPLVTNVLRSAWGEHISQR